MGFIAVSKLKLLLNIVLINIAGLNCIKTLIQSNLTECMKFLIVRRKLLKKYQAYLNKSRQIMAILNYTTCIAVEKTTAEIQKALALAGAVQVLSEYGPNGDGILTAISFRIDFKGSLISFRLPANIDNIYTVLIDQQVPKKLRTHEQAARVAWRIIKDWIKAQMALVEAEQAELAEVFLPYAQNPQTGKTLFESIDDSGIKLLGYN